MSARAVAGAADSPRPLHLHIMVFDHEPFGCAGSEATPNGGPVAARRLSFQTFLPPGSREPQIAADWSGSPTKNSGLAALRPAGGAPVALFLTPPECGTWLIHSRVKASFRLAIARP